METTEILILAFALSIDALTVSFSNGLICEGQKRLNSLLLGTSFGLFQFLMPVSGYFLTQGISLYVARFSKIIVFTIFTFLGLKFIFEAFKKENCAKINCVLDIKYVLLLSVATSIDALGAGISLSLLKNEIFIPALLIGIITFINSLLGFWSAKVINMPAKFLMIFAGMLLILLGIKNICS